MCLSAYFYTAGNMGRGGAWDVLRTALLMMITFNPAKCH